MSQEEKSLKESFESELEKLNTDVLSPEYRRKKTIIWAIRTLIAVVLFIIFWDKTWVRWVLIAYIPLNLFSLFSIYINKVLMEKRINKTRQKIDNAEKSIEKHRGE